MRVVFRTDASVQIGTGHVMRCLTLADALVRKGAQCQFICREHKGNLIEYIRSRGFIAHVLPIKTARGANAIASCPQVSAPDFDYRDWLGATQAQDVEACACILAPLSPDWLIVDHYGLDARWERGLVPHYRNLLVIDDLADRPHACDLLLDQTFGRQAAAYLPLVPDACQLLCGSQYALLRPEFAALRAYSLQRRIRPALRELLISMGGVDKDNATGQVLQSLRKSALPAYCRITVVMGATAPWLFEVREQSQDMPWPTRILVGVNNMAQLMADSDLSIGAAGATSWERCCLGVPTMMLVLAENQRQIAKALSEAGAVHLVDASTLKSLPLIIPEYVASQTLGVMSAAMAAITDGLGVAQVVEKLMDKVQHAN